MTLPHYSVKVYAQIQHDRDQRDGRPHENELTEVLNGKEYQVTFAFKDGMIVVPLQ